MKNEEIQGENSRNVTLPEIIARIETDPILKDLEKIIIERFGLKFEKFRDSIINHGFMNDVDPMHYSDYIEICGREILGRVISLMLHDELKSYKRRFRTDFAQDIEKARNGNHRILFRLISWDKAWLYMGWAKNMVLKAQEEGNTEFLKDLGDAVRAEIKYQKQAGNRHVDRQKRNAIIDFMRTAIIHHKAQIPSLANDKKKIDMIIGIYGKALSHSYPELDEKLFQEEGYLRKYLKRHKVI